MRRERPRAPLASRPGRRLPFCPLFIDVVSTLMAGGMDGKDTNHSSHSHTYTLPQNSVSWLVLLVLLAVVTIEAINEDPWILYWRLPFLPPSRVPTISLDFAAQHLPANGTSRAPLQLQQQEGREEVTATATAAATAAAVSPPARGGGPSTRASLFGTIRRRFLMEYTPVTVGPLPRGMPPPTNVRAPRAPPIKAPPILPLPLGPFLVEACATFASYALGHAPGAWACYLALVLALLPAAALDGAVGGGCKFARPIRRGLGNGACLWLPRMRLPHAAFLTGYLHLLLAPKGLALVLGEWLAEHPNNLDPPRWRAYMLYTGVLCRCVWGAVLLLLAALAPLALRVSWSATFLGGPCMFVMHMLSERAVSAVVDFVHKAHRTLRPVSDNLRGKPGALTLRFGVLHSVDNTTYTHRLSPCACRIPAAKSSSPAAGSSSRPASAARRFVSIEEEEGCDVFVCQRTHEQPDPTDSKDKSIDQLVHTVKRLMD